jgi:hypothetical protein
MKSDTFYFPHDYNARTDPKIKKLIREKGMTGYGCFWAIVEDLYQNANALPTDYESIAYELHEQVDLVKSVICDYGLFCFESDLFGSSSVERRINERNEKSVKARESALKRWNKSETDANAMRTQSDSNAIKEKKVKESKVKEIKSLDDSKFDFKESLRDFTQTYSVDTLKSFFEYWTELNTSKTKMRFQGEKFFDVSRRLATWQKREIPKFENKNQLSKSDKMDLEFVKAAKSMGLTEEKFKNTTF